MNHALRTRRLELKLSQQEVARLAGLKRSNYGHIEIGRHEPSRQQMIAIATALNCSVSELFFAHVCSEK